MDISSITINDGAANVVFTRISRNGSKLNYSALATAILAGRMTIVHEVVQPTDKTAGRVFTEMKMPVIETVDGESKVTRFYRHTSTSFVPPMSTNAERTAFANLVKNYYGHADVLQSLTNLEPFG